MPIISYRNYVSCILHYIRLRVDREEGRVLSKHLNTLIRKMGDVASVLEKLASRWPDA